MVPDAKGHELEHAVRAIEAAILEASPALYDKAFKIEMRKRISARDGAPQFLMDLRTGPVARSKPPLGGLSVPNVGALPGGVSDLGCVHLWK